VADVDEVVEAVRRGALAVIPTDTVYGLVCSPEREDSVRELSRLKGREATQPIALLAASVDRLLELLPEAQEPLLRALLPGPYTLVLPNPGRHYPWLAGERPQTIGVRVPEANKVITRLGAVAATSANRHGGPDPRRLADVPREILDGVAVALDAGELPGTPSTVLDLSGREPRVLREGAVPAAEALARVASALAQ
jgi:L-threonylcarbamoyladenylate synthase